MVYKLFLYTLFLTSTLTVTVIPVRTATSVPIFTIAYASYSAAVAILRTAPILKVKVIILRGHDPTKVLGYVLRWYACSKMVTCAGHAPRKFLGYVLRWRTTRDNLTRRHDPHQGYAGAPPHKS